jgi:hypothetical protein
MGQAIEGLFDSFKMSQFRHLGLGLKNQNGTNGTRDTVCPILPFGTLRCPIYGLIWLIQANLIGFGIFNNILNSPFVTNERLLIQGVRIKEPEAPSSVLQSPK